MDDLCRDQAPGVDQPTAKAEEVLGGEPACWAHLFEDDPGSNSGEVSLAPVLADTPNPKSSQTPIDLVGLTRTFQGRGPAKSLRSTDLDLNLLVFNTGEGVAEHVNTTLDVVLVAVVGEGVVTIDDQPISLKAGQLILIPKGTRRSIQAVSERFSYLSCHRRRAGLMPISRGSAIRRD